MSFIRITITVLFASAEMSPAPAYPNFYLAGYPTHPHLIHCPGPHYPGHYTLPTAQRWHNHVLNYPTGHLQPATARYNDIQTINNGPGWAYLDQGSQHNARGPDENQERSLKRAADPVIRPKGKPIHAAMPACPTNLESRRLIVVNRRREFLARGRSATGGSVGQRDERLGCL